MKSNSGTWYGQHELAGPIGWFLNSKYPMRIDLSVQLCPSEYGPEVNREPFKNNGRGNIFCFVGLSTLKRWREIQLIVYKNISNTNFSPYRSREKKKNRTRK